MTRLLLALALTSGLLAPAPAAAAPAPQKRVLLLYSTRRDTQIAITGDREMPLLLEKGLGEKADIYSEYIDAARFPDEEYKEAFAHYLRLKYSGSRFDVVIALHAPAIELVSRYRNELFRDTPLVFLSKVPSAERLPKSVGVIAAQDYQRTLDMALRMQPDTTHVFVVVGDSNQDHELANEARAQFARFASRVTFTYSSDMTTDDLEQMVAALPEHSIIFYLLFYQDAAGINVNPLEIGRASCRERV